MFRHILFPTDTSDWSNKGFKAAVNIARRYEGKITVLNVHEEFMSKEEMQYLRVSQQNYEEYIREQAVRSREIIEKLIESENAGDLCEILLREGKPRQMISQVAEEIGANLIVMCSKGRTNLADQLIGSVAEHVLRHSKTSVLVLKGEDVE